MSKKIILKNISKKYSTNANIKVLNDLNFSFEKGKIYSLVGPSGSGKSTLLNLLSLIDTPTAGSIEILKNKVNFKEKTKNDRIRSEKIGIIYQDKNLLSDFTALENVYLPKLLLTNIWFPLDTNNCDPGNTPSEIALLIIESKSWL